MQKSFPQLLGKRFSINFNNFNLRVYSVLLKFLFVKITVDPRGQKRVIKLKVLLLMSKTKTESWTELIEHPLHINIFIFGNVMSRDIALRTTSRANSVLLHTILTKQTAKRARGPEDVF